MLCQLLTSGVLAGLTMTVPLPAVGAKGHDRVRAILAAPFSLAVSPQSLSVIASNITPHNS
jgi:hypothetical protein